MRCNISAVHCLKNFAYNKLISRMRKNLHCCLNCYTFDRFNLNVSMEKER